MVQDLEESAKKSAEELEKVRKKLRDLSDGMDSTIKMLLNGAKTEKEKIEITKEYNKQLEKDLAVLKRSNQDESLNIRIVENKIKQNKEFISELDKASSFAGTFGTKVKKVTGPLTKMYKGATLATLAFDGLTSAVKGAFSLAGSFLDAGKRVESFEDITKNFEKFPLIGTLTNKLGKSIDFNVSNFKTLAQVGADFNSSIIQLRYAAASANMPLLDFVDTISKNSDVLAGLFGTTQQGIARFQGLARGLRQITMNEFSQFGLTLNETSDFLATFLELERARGNTQRLTQDELLAGTQAYIRNLVILSKLTGEDIKAIDARNRQQAMNGRFQALLSGRTEEQANRLRLANSELQKINPLFGQLFEQVFAAGQATEANTAQLNMFSGGALVPAFKAFQNGQLSFEGLLNEVGRSSKALIGNNKALARASIIGGEFTEVFTAGAAGVRANSESIDEETKARKTQTAAAVATQDALQRAKSALEKQVTAGLELVFPDTETGIFSSVIKGLDKTAIALGQFSILNAVFDVGKKALRVVSPAGFLISKVFNPKGGQKPDTSGNVPTVVSPDDDMTIMPMYRDGSKGFKDFGSGTLVKLHNKETVIPLNSPMGKVVASLEGAKLDQNPQKVENITNTISNVTAGDTDYDRLAAVFSQGFSTLAGKMDESVNRLNMIAGASAKTADNTGKQIKTLARNPYSVV